VNDRLSESKINGVKAGGKGRRILRKETAEVLSGGK